MKKENEELLFLRTKVHNLEKMYAIQLVTNKKLREENKKLKEENILLKKENSELRAKVEKLELIVEELRKMIFKAPKDKAPKGAGEKKKNENEKKQRGKDSYRRSTPDEKEVTDVVRYEVENCSDCNGPLMTKKEFIRFVEDIYLPTDGKFPLKKVTKEHIEKGYCAHCDKRTYGKIVTSQHATLGDGIRAFIVYSITELSLSYEQMRGFLITMANITISDGEIVAILKKESTALIPENKAMKKRIRKGNCNHFDETGRKVQSMKDKNYARVMVAPDGIERVYILGATRGKGNLEALKGDSKAIGVSDDYGAYKNAFTHHQLCRAHPIRKMRDLVESGKLNTLQIGICKIAYDALRAIHHEIIQGLKGGFSSISDEQKNDRQIRFSEIAISVNGEPEKMSKLKTSLGKNKDKYFTCLKFKNIPTTNNTAERSLRRLVIKRKLSFGSKTSQGASMMENIYSVAYSLLAKSKIGFFDRYLALKT